MVYASTFCVWRDPKVSWKKSGRASAFCTLHVVKNFKFLNLFQGEECTINEALEIWRIWKTIQAIGWFEAR